MYDNRAHNGGGVYNAGTLEVADATLSGNAGDNGGGVFNAPGASLTLRRSTLHANTASDGGQSIANEGTATVEGSILATSGTRDQCSGNTFANAGPNPPVRNLVWGPGCSQSESLAGNVDPRLGTLRDNGGATLTHALATDSPAIDRGFSSQDAACMGQTDQRGRPRPFDAVGAPPLPEQDIGACDLGAYEYGPRTVTVDAAAKTDRAALLYRHLQTAIDESFAGDVIEVRAGAYTGNFIVYRDVTIRHANVDVSQLSPELGYDLRAILQASDRTVEEQDRLNKYAGTTLTVRGFSPPGAALAPADLISVTLSGLTIRHGAGPTGGGIHNTGSLSVDRCTIEGNAAVDVRNADGEVVEEGKGGGIYSTGQVSLRRSTVSGNLAEHFGGAFYSTPGPTKTKALIDVDASTVAGNAAGPIPEQWVVRITDSGLSPRALPGRGRTVRSGDEIRFEDQTGQSHAMTVKQPLPAGVSCTEGPVQVPLIGMGLSTPLRVQHRRLCRRHDRNRDRDGVVPS